MTRDVDLWMEMAQQLEEAARPREIAAREAVPAGEERDALTAWIAHGLKLLGTGVRQSAMAEAAALTREQLRAALAAVDNHAQSLLTLLNGPDVTGRPVGKADTDAIMFAAHVQDAMGGYAFEDGAPGPLQGLAEMLRKASAQARAAGQALPTGRSGRGRHVVRKDVFTARELCALVIHEVWAMLNPVEPAGANENSPALEMAAAYWQICGATPGSFERKAGAWSDDFRAIQPGEEALWPPKNDRGDAIAGPPSVPQAHADWLARTRVEVRGKLEKGEAFGDATWGRTIKQAGQDRVSKVQARVKQERETQGRVKH